MGRRVVALATAPLQNICGGAAVRVTDGADRTLREYVQAWYGIDWDLLRELEQRANAASAMAQLSSSGGS